MREVKQAEKTIIKPYINIKKEDFKLWELKINIIESNTVTQAYNLTVMIKDCEYLLYCGIISIFQLAY